MDRPDSGRRNKNACFCAKTDQALFAERRLGRRPNDWRRKLKRAGMNPALSRIPMLFVAKARVALPTEMQTALEIPPYTQPVGFGRPAILQAPLPGPEGKSS